MDGNLGRRYATFVFGILVITLGIGIITKSSLGTTPVTAIPYTISMVLSPSLGTFSTLFSILLVTLQGIMMWKTFDRNGKVNLALEYVVAVVFGALVDFSMWIFQDLEPSEYWCQLLTAVVGVLVIAFGAYIQLVAHVIMAPGDAFAYALTVRVKRSYGLVRVSSDTVMALIAVAIGLVCLGDLGGVREGTVLCCLLTGTLARFYMRRLGRLTSLLVPGRDLEGLADRGEEQARRLASALRFNPRRR